MKIETPKNRAMGVLFKSLMVWAGPFASTMKKKMFPLVRVVFFCPRPGKTVLRGEHRGLSFQNLLENRKPQNEIWKG